jgi:hypothetical protein
MEFSEQYALTFEAVKTSVRQTKDGYHLTLVLHPNDVPKDLFTSWVGTRYICSLVQLDDQEKPVPKSEAKTQNKIVAQAAQMCRSTRFQAWMQQEVFDQSELPDGPITEDQAAEKMREILGISSRSELAHNDEAANAFELMKESFIDFTRKTF